MKKMKKADIKVFGSYDFGGEFGIWTSDEGKIYTLIEDPWYDYAYADPNLDLLPVVTARAKDQGGSIWFLSFNVSDSWLSWLGDDAMTWKLKDSDLDCDSIDWGGCVDLVPDEY